MASKNYVLTNGVKADGSNVVAMIDPAGLVTNTFPFDFDGVLAVLDAAYLVAQARFGNDANTSMQALNVPVFDDDGNPQIALMLQWFGDNDPAAAQIEWRLLSTTNPVEVLLTASVDVSKVSGDNSKLGLQIIGTTGKTAFFIGKDSFLPNTGIVVEASAAGLVVSSLSDTNLEDYYLRDWFVINGQTASGTEAALLLNSTREYALYRKSGSTWNKVASVASPDGNLFLMSLDVVSAMAMANGFTSIDTINGYAELAQDSEAEGYGPNSGPIMRAPDGDYLMNTGNRTNLRIKDLLTNVVTQLDATAPEPGFTFPTFMNTYLAWFAVPLAEGTPQPVIVPPFWTQLIRTLETR